MPRAGGGSQTDLYIDAENELNALVSFVSCQLCLVLGTCAVRRCYYFYFLGLLYSEKNVRV